VTGNGATALDGSPGLKHVASKTASGLTKSAKNAKEEEKKRNRKVDLPSKVALTKY
jgi:hypothetical protein